MVSTASPISRAYSRFIPVDVAIPQEYLLTDRPTPPSVWGAFDWVKTTANQDPSHYKQFSNESLRCTKLSRADDLKGHEGSDDRFLFLGLSEICGKKLSVEALQEPPFRGWPRVVISEGARGLPCIADCGNSRWYFMRIKQTDPLKLTYQLESNWFLNNHHFPKLRNVVQCAILRYLKSGIRIPNESNKVAYVCARDDRHNSTTLTVGFKGEELHVALFTETDGRHGF